MRTPTRHTLALCAVLTGLLLAGCTTEPDTVTTPQAVESWSAKDEAQAIQEAEQAVRDWLRVSSQCLADPSSSDPSCFDDVSYGDRLTRDQAALKDAQDYGFDYVGEPTYVRTDRVISVDLSIGPDKEIRLAACTSIEDYDVLMPDGTSAIPDETPQRTKEIYVVRKHTSEWQIAKIEDDPEGTEC